MAASVATERPTVKPTGLDVQRRRGRAPNWKRVLALLALALGAAVYLFPFYYMIVGALQREPSTDIAGAFPNPANITLANLADINDKINLARTLLNSAIFTAGVVFATLVLGLLAGYALAQLEFRGRAVAFNAMLLMLVLPFQLLMIPLYVLIVRTYGLADSYLGMILPFAVNSTAVFIFRQFFLQIPRDLFEAARIDGASELGILRRVVVPLSMPAVLTVTMVTFIGPWNEFLWPFLVTKSLELQPLAVALATYISTVSARAANPFGAILAGATVLALPVVILFIVFQRRFVEAQLGSGVKG